MKDAVADKRSHSNAALQTFAEETPSRTGIPEPKLPAGRTRVWTDKVRKRSLFAAVAHNHAPTAA